MKLKTSLTDVVFAVTDSELLSELGWNIGDTDINLEESLFSEGIMRNMIKKYTGDEFLDSYNHYVQDTVMPSLNLCSNIHILDCSKIKVKLGNSNYENSEVIKDDGKAVLGYKIGTLIIEVIFDFETLETCSKIIMIN